MTEYFREQSDSDPPFTNFSNVPIHPTGIGGSEFVNDGPSFFLPPIIGTSEGVFDIDGNPVDDNE